jgi:hypothetical protein
MWIARSVAVGAVVLVLGSAAPAFAQVDVAHWQMDEPPNATTMTDSSGNGFDGVLHEQVVTGLFPGVTGQSGDWAYELNQNTTCTTGTSFVIVSSGIVGISTPTAPRFNPGTQPFSFSMWVNTTGKPGTGNCDFDLIRKGAGWKMEIYPFSKVAQPNCVWNGLVNGVHSKVGLHKPLPQGAINDGAWHQITCQRTANGEALIVDGQTLATSSVDTGNIMNKANVVLGAQEKGVDYFQGLMDDVSFTVG